MKNIYLTFMTKDFAPTELYKTNSICITKVTPLTGLILILRHLSSKTHLQHFVIHLRANIL